MKAFTFATFATLAASAVVDLTRRESPLDVKLEMVGNTAVKASIINTGSTDLKVMKTGTFLDNTAVEKVQVFQGESRVAFEGVRLRVTTVGLDEDTFQTIAAGETVEASFDIAEMHDLSSGGAFDLKSSGVFAYAETNTTELVGAVPYSSNVISAEINAAEAVKARNAFLKLLKRIAVQSDCTSSQRTASVNALANCRTLAAAAQTAAGSNTAKMTEYFKSTSSSTISTVQTVFSRVVSQCGSSTSGVPEYCTDRYPGGACGSNVLAYTVPSQSYIVNCPLYFSALPALTRTCHAQDQATTTLHESTHLTQVKGTQDLGYGYTAATRLSTASALNNADTYALFANAIYAGC